ncbi:ABC transporter ATP-binding protein [Candidatus Omnitrophota bacterium]
MAHVSLRNITKVYPGHIQAVDNFNLEIDDKEFLVLVGPSGCGKSTILRMIAGLEEISSGEISIDDKIVNDVPAKNRDIAMVFQNYALYPHMNVYNNMAFGLKLRKYPKAEIDKRVNEASKILGITHLLKRKPKALSGGQRQRVAVGRAIVRKPKVFLFDEPLSNLDAKLRVQMRTEIQRLHTRLQTTMIYVTHDQIEAMTMGDRIVVIRDGLLQQHDDPLNLYGQPKNKFVAGFIGSPPMNFIAGTIKQVKGDLLFEDSAFCVKVLESMHNTLTPYINKSIILGIRPEDIYDKLFAQDASEKFVVKAKVEVVEPMGAEIYLYLTAGSSKFIARVTALDTASVNQELECVFDMNKAHFFDKNTEATIC